MGVTALVLLAVGLAMDAFAVAVCKGLAIGRPDWGRAGRVGLWFGIFQAGMPAIGYGLGAAFAAYITALDHWIAFLLLSLIGGNMIREALSGEDCADASVSASAMLPLALATSIDALAIGITFAFLQVRLLPAVLLIGALTFAISAVGVRLGALCGGRLQTKAELLGGGILIVLGIRILAEHIIMG